MALKDVFIEENPLKEGQILVFVLAESPRKPEGCPGEVKLDFELESKNTARWGKGSDPRVNACSECGVAMALNTKMLREAFDRAEASLREKNLPLLHNL